MKNRSLNRHFYVKYITQQNAKSQEKKVCIWISITMVSVPRILKIQIIPKIFPRTWKKKGFAEGFGPNKGNWKFFLMETGHVPYKPKKSKLLFGLLEHIYQYL